LKKAFEIDDEDNLTGRQQTTKFGKSISSEHPNELSVAQGSWGPIIIYVHI
jgi:hypothetical protein